MRLDFCYLPTSDLAASLRLYRDQLGFDELWREGDTTVGLAIPGNEAALMIDGAGLDGWGPGPIFGVDSVAEFHAEHGDLDVITEPYEIPGGNLMAARDPSGNIFYVMDQTGEAG
jgi:catechol 2,3-dioxygenase-like lactoylglutathione lyase family enzyme